MIRKFRSFFNLGPTSDSTKYFRKKYLARYRLHRRELKDDRQKQFKILVRTNMGQSLQIQQNQQQIELEDLHDERGDSILTDDRQYCDEYEFISIKSSPSKQSVTFQKESDETDVAIMKCAMLQSDEPTGGKPRTSNADWRIDRPDLENSASYKKTRKVDNHNLSKYQQAIDQNPQQLQFVCEGGQNCSVYRRVKRVLKNQEEKYNGKTYRQGFSMSGSDQYPVPKVRQSLVSESKCVQCLSDDTYVSYNPKQTTSQSTSHPSSRVQFDTMNYKQKLNIVFQQKNSPEQLPSLAFRPGNTRSTSTQVSIPTKEQACSSQKGGEDESSEPLYLDMNVRKTYLRKFPLVESRRIISADSSSKVSSEHLYSSLPYIQKRSGSRIRQIHSGHVRSGAAKEPVMLNHDDKSPPEERQKLLKLNNDQQFIVEPKRGRMDTPVKNQLSNTPARVDSIEKRGVSNRPRLRDKLLWKVCPQRRPTHLENLNVQESHPPPEEHLLGQKFTYKEQPNGLLQPKTQKNVTVRSKQHISRNETSTNYSPWNNQDKKRQNQDPRRGSSSDVNYISRRVVGRHIRNNRHHSTSRVQGERSIPASLNQSSRQSARVCSSSSGSRQQLGDIVPCPACGSLIARINQEYQSTDMMGKQHNVLCGKCRTEVDVHKIPPSKLKLVRKHKTRSNFVYLPATGLLT